MRVSPLGILAHALAPAAGARLGRKDAALTHPHPVCQEASGVLVMAIAHAISTGSSADETYGFVMDFAASGVAHRVVPPAFLHPEVRECLGLAAKSPPADYEYHKGWVLLGLHNAFWQLLHAPGLEEGVCDTVMRGGDTDTNAAIAGALLGAVYGEKAVPSQWREALLSCRPEKGRPGVNRPRPQPFWPVDALTLAERLTVIGAQMVSFGHVS